MRQTLLNESIKKLWCSVEGSATHSWGSKNAVNKMLDGLRLGKCSKVATIAFCISVCFFMTARNSFAAVEDNDLLFWLYSGDELQSLAVLSDGLKVDVNKKDANGDSALMLSAKRKYHKCAEILLKQGAKVNETNLFGETAIYWAASNDDVNLLNLLIRNKANVNAETTYGWTPLAVATVNGRTNATLVLSSSGAVVKSIVKFKLSNDLVQAVTERQLTVVLTLLENGADPNFSNYQGIYPLEIASVQADEALIRLLLAGGADPKRAFRGGRTVMSILKASNRADLLSTVESYVAKQHR